MTPTILIVDDDEDIRTCVADVLETEGYRVITAANGREALDRLFDGASTPSLILLDMMMPVMDGWTFMEQLRHDGRFTDLPVIVFTAYGNPSETASALGAAGHLAKPPRIEDLLSVVERCKTH